MPYLAVLLVCNDVAVGGEMSIVHARTPSMCTPFFENPIPFPSFRIFIIQVLAGLREAPESPLLEL
jgi:hypothetical protein